MYFNDMGNAEFLITSTYVNYTGFDPLVTIDVNITSIPRYCDAQINQRLCDYCTTLNPGLVEQYRRNCTIPITYNTCTDGSPFNNSAPCMSIGGVTASPAVYASGTALLGSLAITEIDRGKAYAALLNQCLVYVIISLVLGFLYYRDWSRRNMFSEIYHKLFTTKKNKQL